VSQSDPAPSPNRHEKAARELRSRDRAAARTYGDPFGRFVLIQLAWGLLGALLGLLLGSWPLVIVNFVVFAGAGFVARVWLHRRHASR
jgi:hypothetical protein